MVRSRVDLPEPDGPRITVTDPGGISSDTLSSALWRPKNLLTPVMEICPSREACMDGLLCGRGGDGTGTGTAEGTVLIHRRATFAAGQSPLNTILDSGQHGGNHQVPGGTYHQQRDHLLRAVVNHLDGVEQL